MGYSYPSVRVAHPGDLSVLGGGTLAGAVARSHFSTGAKWVDPAPSDIEDNTQLAPQNADATKEHAMAPPDNKADERWIAHEDAKEAKRKAKEAKSREEAKARAKAKA